MEFDDPAQALGRHLRAVASEGLAQLPAAVRPAMGEPHSVASLAPWRRQAIVAGVAVHLQDAVEAVEEALVMRAAAPGRI